MPFAELRISLPEGPPFDDYASGSGQYAEQAQDLGDLRERLLTPVVEIEPPLT